MFGCIDWLARCYPHIHIISLVHSGRLLLCLLDLQQLEGVASSLPGGHVDTGSSVIVLEACVLRDRDVKPLRIVSPPPVRLVV